MIYISPLSSLEETLARTGASHLVTLMAGNKVQRPSSIAPENHLVMGISDIIEPREGYVLAQPHHVEVFLAFLGNWNRERPLLLHCWAGISRSTAAAYIATCALVPHICEHVIAQNLRSASPSATPNPHLISLADTVLNRNGRMINAIAAIGRGADAFEGVPFSMGLDFT
jgi:predicted protein tyrosine phosphatase